MASRDSTGRTKGREFIAKIHCSVVRQNWPATCISVPRFIAVRRRIEEYQHLATRLRIAVPLSGTDVSEANRSRHAGIAGPAWRDTQGDTISQFDPLRASGFSFTMRTRRSPSAKGISQAGRVQGRIELATQRPFAVSDMIAL